MKKKWLSIFCAGVLTFGSVTMADATTITLDFNSLPSAQGWQFVGNGLNEADVSSATGSSLLINTMGKGYSALACYLLPNVLDISKFYMIEVRAKLLDEELDSQGAFSFAATQAGWYSLVALGKAGLTWEETGVNRTFVNDNSIFHDFRLEVSPNRSQSLFIDNILVATGTVDAGALPNIIYFGDVSSGVNGRTEITHFVFQQGEPAPVPEPATMLLLGTGLAGLAGSRFRKKK